MPSDPLARMEQGIRISSWLWVVGVIVTVGGVAVLVGGVVGGRDRVRLEQALFTAWALGPPIWFVIQHYLWPAPATGLQRFQAHQALLRPVWAGITILLAAIIFGRWG